MNIREEIRDFLVEKTYLIYKDYLILKYSYSFSPFQNWKAIQKECFAKIFDITMRKDKIKNLLQNVPKDKKKYNSLIKQQEIITLFEKIVRKIMDSIFWMMMDGQTTYINKFYKKLPTGSLKSSNIDDEWAKISLMNKISSDSFTLYTDLTNIVQIGDGICLCKHENKIDLQVIEFKSGKKNEMMLDFIQDFKIDLHQIDEKPYLKELMNKKDYKHLKRILRQKKRMKDTAEIVNTDKYLREDGIFHILIDSPPVEYFYDEIEEMIQDLTDKKPVIKEIDRSLNIGVYSNKYGSEREIFHHFFDRYEDNLNIISVYNSDLEKPDMRPLFLSGFSEKVVEQVLFNDIWILFDFNIDIFIEEAESKGFEFKFKKPTQDDIKMGIMRFGKKGVYLVYEKRDLALTNSFFFKVTNHLIKPKTLLYQLDTIQKHHSKRLKDKIKK